LALDFPEEDAALSDEEETELGAYANINELLAYWQSKARQRLQQPA
jgi:hypothetical protein